MINTWGIKRCGHYQNLNVCILVGGAWTFTNSIVTCFMSHTVTQITRLTTSSVKTTVRTRTSRAANQFVWLQKDPFLPIPNWASFRSHPASVVELAENLYVSGVGPIHALVILTWEEGQASLYILFLSRSVYSLTKQARRRRAFPSITTKSWSTEPV